MATSEKTSNVSDFYLACRNGDVKFVKNYLIQLSDTKWNPNDYEPNVKSTPLHVACFYGHKEIVQLLLEFGCDRSQTNSYGLTAYEEAANDEIRELFKRPTDGTTRHRFQEDPDDSCFDLVKKPKELNEKPAIPAAEKQAKSKKKPALQGYKTKAEKQTEVGYATTSIAMCQSKIGRFLADTFHGGKPMSVKGMADKLQEIVDREIASKNDPQAPKANELLKGFLNDSENERVEHLIRLYTLETNFYRSLKDNPIPLALPLYMTLEKLKNRYFQGESYRGAKMDNDDIATYEWAIDNPGSLLQTRHFSSTSLRRSVAEEFSTGVNKKPNDVRHSVLLIFNFPEVCSQAINLNRISDEEPCLSDFADEAEILILPWTLFQVDSVEKTTSSSYTIHLTNVILPRKGMLSSLKWILKHPKGSIDRFHEHFSEKKQQPETVVEQLKHTLSVPDSSILEIEDEVML